MMSGTFSSCLQQKPLRGVEWSIAATLPPAPGQPVSLGMAGAVIGISDDLLLIGGGANFPEQMPWDGGKKRYYDEVCIYLRQDDQLVLQSQRSKLPASIAYAAVCSTPRGLFYAGGENDHGISRECWLIRGDKNTRSAIFAKLPDLPVPLTNASAAEHDGYVYVAGGETPDGASTSFFIMNMEAVVKEWTTLPPLPRPVSHAVLLAQSSEGTGSLYLMGGRSKARKGISTFYDDVLEFNVPESAWKAKKSLPYKVCAGTGAAVGTNYLMLFGGDKGETFHKVEMMIDSINNEQEEGTKQRMIEAKVRLQSTHPGFSKDILLYNTITDEWQRFDTIPFPVPVTTSAVIHGQDIIIPSGEIRAGVRTPQILMGRIK